MGRSLVGVCKGPCEWTSASIVMLYSVGFHNKKILIIKMSNMCGMHFI